MLCNRGTGNLEHLVHHRKASAVRFVRILRNLLGEDGEVLVDEQLVQYVHVQRSGQQLLRGSLCQAQLVDVKVGLVGDVGCAQQKVRGDVEEPGNAKQHIAGNL